MLYRSRINCMQDQWGEEMQQGATVPFAPPGATGRDCAPAVLAGLLGRGIQQSRSPAMHESEAAAQGLRLTYRLFDTERSELARPIGEILDAAEICGFAGLNVTYPHKIEVLDSLDMLSDAARAVGAVNTVVFRNGRRSGHNTDMWGFAESFRQGMAGVARERVLLLGAGGAGVAVAHALMDCEVKRLMVADSDTRRAEALVERLELRHPGRAEVSQAAVALAGDLDGIVNATPVGMAKLPGTPIDADLLRPGQWVTDIIYFPLETALLAAARARGCRVLTGTGMAVFQAVRAFELFTGLKADPARMRARFDEFSD
jgi:shikimate dehydrogenase